MGLRHGSSVEFIQEIREHVVSAAWKQPGSVLLIVREEVGGYGVVQRVEYLAPPEKAKPWRLVRDRGGDL